MKLFKSLSGGRFRQTFLSFYALGSLLPLLVMVYVLAQYVFPALKPEQQDALQGILALTLGIMLLVPMLGFLLMRWWVKSLESLHQDVQSATHQILPQASNLKDENEMLSLRYHFEGLYTELQEKMNQLSEYSQRLIDDNIKLSTQAATDELTTLYNRRYFDIRLLEETSRADRHEHQLSLIMIDADGFKSYNDKFGHPAGDRVLRHLGRVIRASIRKSDIPFRYGGDEFAVILPQCPVKDAARIAGKMVKAVIEIELNDSQVQDLGGVTISCGVAQYAGALDRLVTDADKCLYAAKSKGAGKVVFAPSKNGKTGPENGPSAA